MGCGASSADKGVVPAGGLEGFFASQTPGGTGTVRKVLFMRHANAAPRDAEATAREFGLDVADLPAHANAWLACDQNRPLTDKGREQAAAALSTFMPDYDVCFGVASEAARATETLEIVAPDHGGEGVRKPLPQLRTMHCRPLLPCTANRRAIADAGGTVPDSTADRPVAI